ncbi:MAG: PASTA domain-containing protein [Bacteroidota bacterium]
MNFFKSLGANIFAIIISVIVVFTVVSFILNSYTRHGESLTVPDIRGLKISEMQRILSEKKLQYVITDSLFFADKPALSVVEQNPSPQSKVKEGRIIYITINANSAPTVLMPNLVDISIRQASAMLLNVGLKPGKLIYKPDIAQNVVLDMLYRGQTIKAESKIPKGSTIDLVLGDGLDGSDVSLPDLKGLTLEEASNLLASSSLNKGSVIFEGAVKDSSSAKVFKQDPPFNDGKMLRSGHAVDLFLKQE